MKAQGLLALCFLIFAVSVNGAGTKKWPPPPPPSTPPPPKPSPPPPPSKGNLTAYPQWVAIDIEFKSFGSKQLEVKNSKLNWGKWYDFPDKDREVSGPDGLKIEPGKATIQPIAACGRQGAASGTEGSFEFYIGNLTVGSVYFDCPWSGSNKLSGVGDCEDCWVSVPPISKEGAIGRVTVKVAYLKQ